MFKFNYVSTISHVGQTDQIDHDLLDHLYILTCRNEMLCRICIVQIQPRKYVLDHADYEAPTMPHELDHAYQESVCPERSPSCSGDRWSV